MELLTDTKHLKIQLDDVGRQLLYNTIIKRYGYTSSANYSFIVRDKRYGVVLSHFPKAPYANYSTALSFQGYSNESPLLQAVFKLIPLIRWKARRIDMAFDSSLPYEELHVVSPPKRATKKCYPTSLYLGRESSPVQLHAYDKQEQMLKVRGVKTDTWTRVELRFRFEPMKKVTELTTESFSAAKDYWILPDITAMPKKLLDEVRMLNLGIKDSATRTTQAKIREYGYEHGVNLFNIISSTIETKDINALLYVPSKQFGELSS